MPEEYFIRGPEEETARGPYNLDKLRTLAEANIISREFFYFDSKMEAWARLSTNQDLLQAVFPEKRKLNLNRTVATAAETSENNAESAVKIEDMLAAAEGYTKETRHVREMGKWRERTANIAVPTIGVLLIASAFSMIYPSWSVVQIFLDDPEGSWLVFLQSPVVILGALDLVMGIMILLNAVEIFPVVRLRAMLGGGFFSVVYFSQYLNGDANSLWLTLGAIAFSIGLFTCTLTLNFRLMVTSALLGIGGILCMAWFNNLLPLITAFSKES